MQEINLRDLYPDVYKEDMLVKVSEDVLAVITADHRADAAHERQMYRYKAHYSLDCDNGIEKAALPHTSTPEELLEEKLQREELYAAVMSLPEKQAKRVYAHFYLGMTAREIADAEHVDASCIRRSIRNGLKRLAKNCGNSRLLYPFGAVFVSTYKKDVFLLHGYFDNRIHSRTGT